MDRRRAAGVLLALAASVAYATAAPTASNHTSLDLYEGAPDGCYYNFQHYGEGDRIMTNEPCLNCTCHNRMLMCYLRVCPFTKPIGQDCTIEKRADQCCPIVTCPDVPVDLLTSTTNSPAEYGATGLGKLDKYGCSIHGKYFPEGSKVPPTPNKPCEHCYCIRNMTTCVMQECTLHVDGCTPIYHKDVCCPVRYSCDHPEDEMPLLDDLSTTVRPTPGFLLTTTTLSPVTQMSQDCLYENQVIRDGALIKTEKACDHCYCMKGDIVCVVQECGTPMENEGKNCTALAPREGVCCPDTYICEGDEPTTGTYETDYTTELEKLTTITPPRRAGSEGSGYRIETDGNPDTETETEGSGYEQVTIHPTIVTEAPESHKIEASDEKLSTTVKASDGSNVITEGDLQKDTASQHHMPSTTSAYTSLVDESLSTKTQDEDIGSGEEDIVTPYETVSTSSSSPTENDNESTISNDQNAVTTDSTKEIDSEIHVKVPTTGAPTEDENKTDIPKEQSVSTDENVIDLTTRRPLGEDEDVETSTTFDDEHKFTEHDSSRTTSIPIVEENESKITESPEQGKVTSETHYYATPSTSAPGFEEEIATTEPQDTETDRFDGTVPEFDVHHQVTMTASTPLLEEIEKDTTDQEIIRDESTPDEGKMSTILSNIPTEESISKDSMGPDPIDETIATNIPTTVSTFEDEVKTTSDTTDTNYENSSEPQQYSPTTVASVSDYETENTISIDSKTTSKPHESQETDTNEDLEDQYASTVSAPVFEDKTMEITSLHDITTSKLDDTNIEMSSEPQQYSPTTSGPMLDDGTKDKEISQTAAVEVSSEPQEYSLTTNTAIFDVETKISTPSDIMTSSKTQEGQETGIEDSSEPQQNTPTTRRPLIDDETIAPEDQETSVTDVSDSLHNLPTTSAPTSEDEINISTSLILDKDTTESSETLPTTNAPVFEDENRKTTISDSLTTSEAQEGQKLDIDDSLGSNQHAPITSAPVFEDEDKRTTQSEVFTTSKDVEDQKTDVDDSLESFAPTTSSQIFEDKSKITTPSDSMTTIRIQDIQESDVKDSSDSESYAPTTSASNLEDESKVTSLSDSKESTTKAPEFEEKPKETSTAITFEQNEITTTEPDKGLNTIPSGSVEEETTESPGIAKHTHIDELIPTESATEQGNKLYDVTELEEDATEHSKLGTSASPEDLITETTESTVKENIDKISSTETRDIAEQTTAVPTDIIEEALSTLTYDHPPSTKHPTSESQESSTTALPLSTEADSETPITIVSSYEHSPETTSSQSSEDSQTVTSSPSYTVPVSTTADLEENEISNESRIPGEGDCLLNGVTYRNESAVPSSNKCQSGCKCSSSIIKCDPIICSPPPEYMDNCQTTYDSPDSCCPTYVCDHKTETMPPQSHSQMSGTEAPVESPIKCVGDECILSQDKKDTEGTSESCDSGSCTGQAESNTHPTNVPKQPAEDGKEGCTGSSCTPLDSSECNQENGCQAFPVKPCEGIDCDVSSDATPPKHQEPCIGENCDIPVRDCSTGKCDDENKLNVENECTEESCRRKEGSESEQQPPKKCSGSECQSTETTSEIGLTTLGSFDTGTEKIEQSSQSPVTETDFKSDEHVTEAIIISESQSTTVLPSESTKLSDQDSNKDDIITSPFGPTTPSEQEETSVPDSTKVDDENDIESPPYVYTTDKLELDSTTKAGEMQTDIPDLSLGEKSTVSAEITTAPPKMHTEEFTKVPSIKDSQDITTLTSHEEHTMQPPEKQVPEDISTSISEDITTKISLTEEANNNAITDQPTAPDSMQHETTKLPLDMNEDATVKYDSEEVTKLPQVSEEVTTVASEDINTTSKISDSHAQDTTASADSTTQADIIGTEISKPDTSTTDLLETTEIPKDSQSEETSAKTTTDFVTQSKVTATTISSQASTEIETESSSDVSDKTKDTQSLVTTQVGISAITMTEDEKTDSPSEGNVPDVTESSQEPFRKETTVDPNEEMSTQTLKPYSTQPQETTLSSDKTDNVEVTKISAMTEPSLVSDTEEPIVTKSPEAYEFTRTDGTTGISETKPLKDDEVSHETDLTKIIDDAVTESSKPGEPEFISTTKSSLADSDSQGPTEKVPIETDMESTTSDETEPQVVTQSTDSVSVALSDVTTIQSLEDDQKLFSESDVQENITLQPVIVSELTTQSVLVPDSKITETERTDVNEITTATESSEKETSISTVSTIDEEDDLTSITHHKITTESSLDLVTITIPHSAVTVSSDKPGELDETTPTGVHITTSIQSITGSPIEQESETPAEVTQTQATDVLETEKDTMSERTTSKPSDITDLSNNVDEQPVPIDSHEEQPSETSTKPADRITTEPTQAIETKQPVTSEVQTESQTDKPFIYEDDHKSEAPLSNEVTTAIFEEEITENPKDIVEEPGPTHYHELNTIPTESKEEAYTEMPLHVSSYGETTKKPNQINEDEVTTAAIQISEQTSESANVFTNAPTESSAPQDVQTEIIQKEPLDIDVTQQTETTPDIEGSQDKETQTEEPLDTDITQEVKTTPVTEGSQDKEIQTIVPDLTSDQESTIQEQHPTDMVKLTTESPKDTETLEESVTEKPVYTETITELIEATTDGKEKLSGEEEFKPVPSATTVSEEQNTKDQDDRNNISTEKSITTETIILETTKTQASIESSTVLSGMITSHLGEDTSTPKYELSELTTVSIVDDEIIHVDKETTEIPTTVFDQQTDGIVTEHEQTLFDTTTKQQEAEDLIPIKTEGPEMYPTTISATEEPAKLTPSPIEEASTESDLLISSEPHATEEGKLTTSLALDVEKASTPKTSEIEVETEKVTTPTESPVKPETSKTPPEEKQTTVREDEKQTTAKAEEITTAYPVFTKPTHKPTDASATEQPKPIPTEEQSSDDILSPDDESSVPPSGTSGYGTDPDYMEEDQTFGPGTCRYGGKVYVSAQQIPRDDPCDFCFCFRSDIICLQQSCPPPIHGCHEEPISGFCCPRYECPVSMATTVNVTTTTTTTTTTLPPHFPVHSYKGSAQKRGCLIKGHTYKVGEVVRASSGPCLHCTCGGDGQMKCDPKQCTPEPMLRQMIAAAVSAKRRR